MRPTLIFAHCRLEVLTPRRWNYDLMAVDSPELPYHVREILEIYQRDYNIIFITTHPDFKEDLLAPYNIMKFFKRENRGYDFPSYKLGLSYLEDQGIQGDVLLLNCGVFARPEFLSRIDILKRGRFDFFGISYNKKHKRPHIQSFYLYFRRRILLSEAWRKFWRDKVLPDGDKEYVINNNEISLTEDLVRGGFSPGFLCYFDKWSGSNFLNGKIPFIKIRDNEDLYQYYKNKYLKASGKNALTASLDNGVDPENPRYVDLFSRFTDYIQDKFKPGSFIDIGSGVGLLVEIMNRRGVFSIGIDKDPVFKEFFESRNENSTSFYCDNGGNLSNYPRVDLITCIETAGYMANNDFKKLLPEISKKCKYFIFSMDPGGPRGSSPDKWIEVFESWDLKLIERIRVPNKYTLVFESTWTPPRFSETPGIRRSLKKKAVYTVIFGDYDKLRAPVVYSPDWDYICFTDNKNLKSEIWDIRYIKSGLPPPVLAREYYINSQKYLSKYDLTIMIIGAVEILGDLDDFIDNFCDLTKDLNVPQHSRRICTYKEGREVVLCNQADPEIVYKQLGRYKKEGFPENWGLCENGILIRLKNDRLRNFEEAWTKETFAGALRDQLSLMFILWKYDFISYNLLDYRRIYKDFFRLWRHKGDEEVCIVSIEAGASNIAEVSRELRKKRKVRAVFDRRSPHDVDYLDPEILYGFDNVPDHGSTIIIVSSLAFDYFGSYLQGKRGIDIKTFLRSWDKIKIIIGDSFYMERPDHYNYLFKDYEVFCHHCKIQGRGDLPTKIYYQPFDLSHIPIKKADKLTIGHSPFSRDRWEKKGTEEILSVIKSNYGNDPEIKFKLIQDLPREEALLEKSKCHIFIDQIDARDPSGGNYNNWTGGIGKSGLEALLLDCLVISWGKHSGGDIPAPPVAWCTRETFPDVLDYYIKNPGERDKMIKKSKAWGLKYLDPAFCVNNLML